MISLVFFLLIIPVFGQKSSLELIGPGGFTVFGPVEQSCSTDPDQSQLCSVSTPSDLSESYCQEEGLYTLKAKFEMPDIYTIADYLNPYTVIFDKEEKYCTDVCIQRPVEWDDNVFGNGCCGDDSYTDCGFKSGGKVCGNFEEGIWTWEDLADIQANTMKMWCSPGETDDIDAFVTDGSTIYRCGRLNDGTRNKTINITLTDTFARNILHQENLTAITDSAWQFVMDSNQFQQIGRVVIWDKLESRDTSFASNRDELSFFFGKDGFGGGGAEIRYVDINPLLSNPDKGKVSFWMKPDDGFATDEKIATLGAVNLYKTANGIKCGTSSVTGTLQSENGWYLVSLSWDKSVNKVTCGVGGLLVDNAYLQATIPAITIYNGMIDDFKVYDTAVPSPELSFADDDPYDAQFSFQQPPEFQIPVYEGTGNLNYYLGKNPFTIIEPFQVRSIAGEFATHDFLCYRKFIGTQAAWTISECIGDELSIAQDQTEQTFDITGASYETGRHFYDNLGGGASVTTATDQFTYDPEILPPEGKIEMLVNPNWYGNDSKDHILFFYGTPDLYFQISKTAGNRLECRMSDTVWVDDADMGYALTWEPGNWYKIGIRWTTQPFNMTCYGEEPIGWTPSMPGIPVSDKIWIGGHPSGNPDLISDAVFDEFRIYYEEPKVFYCTTDGSWDTDLDIYDERSCTESGFVWTGNYCCSEAEDELETYNDNTTAMIATPGGCWEGGYVSAGFFVGDTPTGQTGKILNYQGTFMSCGIGQDDERINRTDTHTDEKVITNYDPTQCNVLSQARGVQAAFCSGDGWVITDDPSERTSKTIDPGFSFNESTMTSTGCCLVTSCWNGTSCVQDQSNEAIVRTQYDRRCIAGEWLHSPLKKTWDRANFGYCAQPSSCLVNPTGDPASNGQPAQYFNNFPQNVPQCIYNGQYIGPYYCEDGGWGSRTKLIGLQLLEFAESNFPSDYELFCGDYEDFLNFYGYEVLVGGGAVLRYIEDNCVIETSTVPCVNEFCGLRYQNKIGFGVSLNNPIDGDMSFLNALGKDVSHCDGAMNNDGDYDSCGESIFYNHDTESLIYLPTGTLGQDTVQDLITNRLPLLLLKRDEVEDFALTPWTALSDELVQSLVNQTTLLKKLFYAKHGDKILFAFIEEQQAIFFADQYVGHWDYLGLLFQDFRVTDVLGTDACDLVKGTFTGIDSKCFYDPATDEMTYIIIYDPLFEPVGTAWSDFTSKLRYQ